jgi:RNA polymerase sigma-70 factor (ECF subfamily)
VKHSTATVSPAETKPEEPPEVSQVVEHLFRHEAGKMVAALTGVFGIEHLTLAEDVVQEALARALQTWPFYGVPKNPAAWIMRASRNLALDVVRREKVFRQKQAELVHLMDQESPAPAPAVFSEQDIADDRLRLLFVCCHPLVPADAQVALALKVLGGFSAGEMARAFLTTEAAIAKRLTRAKQKIRQARIPFEIPTGDELAGRLDAVLQSLYLLFSGGYKASSGEKLVRAEICQEAIRLTGLLVEHAAGNVPRSHALLALMLMNAARIPARLDGEGNLLRLKEQNRSQWDQAMIARGLFHFAQSAAGEEITEYHLEAAIAASHCAAKDYASTDWRQILQMYDRLMEFNDSPVVALNRAVALAEVHGPTAGIAAVHEIQNLPSLESYHLLHAVLGDFESRLHHAEAAAAHFRKSLQLAQIKSEQSFLSKRLQACQDQIQAVAKTDRPEILLN